MNQRTIDLIKQNEGFSATVYLCPAGFHTIGYGHNCDAHGDLDAYINRTISPAEADDLLLTDIDDALKDLTNSVRTFDSLDEVRQAVLIDMCFNLGINGLKKFKKFLGYLLVGNYRESAREMYSSKWFTQVPLRASKNMFMILTGEYF